MDMDGVTPETGADTVTSAAAKIADLGLLELESDPVETNSQAEQESENPPAQAESEPEETDNGDSEGEQEASANDDEEEPESQESEEQGEEKPSSWTLNELAEAMELTPEQVLQTIKLTATVNGESEEVTLDELQRGFQRERDTTQKSMRLAEERKALEAEREAAKAEITTRLQEATHVVQLAEQQLLSEYEGINWEELRSYDPGEYAAKRSEVNEKLQRINANKAAIAQESARIAQENALKQEQEFAKFLEEERPKLLNAIPEWADEKKAEEGKRAVAEYVLGQGYPQEILSRMDHKDVVMARKAMLYDQLQNGKPALTKKVKDVPKFVKPGAKKSKQEVGAETRKTLRSKLKKTGRAEDAIGLIETLL